MPTTLPVRRATDADRDDFPLWRMLTLAALGISAGLWIGDGGDDADAAIAMQSPPVVIAQAPLVKPVALQGTELLSGLRFAP